LRLKSKYPEYEIAKTRFKRSINPNEPENTFILWNDYVYATIAFLNNDMPKLKLYRDKIANGPILVLSQNQQH
jgi:hypothetical protein